MTAILAVLGMALVGCGGSEQPASRPVASATVASPAAPATAVVTPSPQPVPSAAPTELPFGAPPPDPTVIPEDPADIDVAYMQAVVDVFEEIQGDIFREAVGKGELTADLINMMDQAYGAELRDASILDFQQRFADDSSLPDFQAEPGNPIWTVENLLVDDSSCAAVEISADKQLTARSPEEQQLVLVFVAHDDPTPRSAWRLEHIYAVQDTGWSGNPCAA